MKAILKSLKKIEEKFDRRAERFVFRHPHMAFLVMFVGMPLFILAAVAALTMVIVFPTGMLMGWL